MSGIVWPDGSKSIPRVSSEFNPARRNPVTGIVQPHNGVDLVGFEWNRAPEDGRVTLAGYNGGAGIEVRIVADGPNAFQRGTTYRILHNAPNSLRVSVGDRVTAGQIVARQGTTGQSTGVHTHFETHPGSSWNPTNPRAYMAAALASPAGGGGKPFEPAKPPAPEEEEEDMPKNAGFYYPVGGKPNTFVVLIVYGAFPGYHEYGQGDGGGLPPASYNNPVAAALETGSFVPITEGHARVLKASIDKAANGDANIIAQAILALDDDEAPKP